MNIYTNIFQNDILLYLNHLKKTGKPSRQIYDHISKCLHSMFGVPLAIPLPVPVPILVAVLFPLTAAFIVTIPIFLPLPNLM